MDKLEKVTKGLERCIEKQDTVANKTHGFNCTACPYFRKCDSSGYLIGLPLMRDALALLKAQEPRVMTLDEVRKLPRGALVWQEHRGVNQPRPRVVHCVTDEFIIYTDGGKWYFELDDYGTKFRLWTTEPSEMKRQAVKWDG